MYFENRYSAGKQLISHLAQFKRDAIILCTNDGSVLVAEPIAQSLMIPVLLLITRDIKIPGEKETAPTVGTLDQAGGFTYNSMLSSGEVSEFVDEYHGHLEQEKMQQMHEINKMISDQGDVPREYLNDRNIILISDGLATGTIVDATVAYLKPVRTKKIVAVAPFASIPAIDRLHIQTDMIICLDVKENYLSTEHYYNDNAIPSRKEIQQRLQLFEKYL